MNILVKIILCFIFPLFSVYSKTLQFHTSCGEYLFSIIINNVEQYDEKTIKFFSKKPHEVNKQFYQTVDMHVTAACTKAKNGKDFFIFKENCSGSACIESIYGLYDPQREQFLLVPKDWPQGNEDQVKNILGKKPKELAFDINNDFCCVSQLAEYRYNISLDTAKENELSTN